MPNIRNFLRYSFLGTVFSVIVLFILFFFGILSGTQLLEALWALFIPAIHFFPYLVLMHKAMNKPHVVFMKIFFGGMAIRFFSILLFIIFSIKLLNMSENLFILLIFLFYFCFLSIEITYFAKIKTNSQIE